ncbi:MAG: SigE family RNA polymerase sigma factor [Nocardioidaceae bacterium]
MRLLDVEAVSVEALAVDPAAYRSADLGWLGSRGMERLGEAAEASFVEFVRARQGSLLRFAYLLTADHQAAEDLVQTALVKTYLAWSRVREAGALDAYVRRIIVNENVSVWRRAWKRREYSSETLPEGSVVDPVVDDRDELWAVVRSLPPRQRATIVLRFYEDLSEAEIAEVMACSVGTVKSQTSRALAALRRRVEENSAVGEVADD